MSRRRLIVGLGAALLLLSSSAALAITQDPGATTFEIPMPQYMLVQNPSPAFAAQVGTDQMSQRYGGNWHIGQWNQFSRTPQSIYGSGVELAPSGLSTDRVAEAVSYEFVTSNADILGIKTNELVFDRVIRGGDKVAVHFDQLYHGIPVVGANVHTISMDTGRLYYMSSQFYRDIDVSPIPSIGEATAVSIAQSAVGYNFATDTIEGAPELVMLPVPAAESGSDYHLVWRVRVQTVDPFAIWVSHVDAHSGEVVYRFNDVHNLYSGTQQGDVDNTGYCDGFDTLPFREMDISVSGAGNTVTAPDGTWSINASNGNQTMTVEFDGPQQRVVRQDGPEAIQNVAIAQDAPLVFDWNDGNSDRAERDCFHWVNEVDAFVKNIDGTYNHGKYTCNVNWANTCNANWGGTTMNFFSEGGGCPNTAYLADVMSHEFGHGVQADLLGGSQGGEGLGEGNGDILSSFMTDDPRLAVGWNLGNCSSFLRTCDNTRQYPGDLNGSVHNDGQIMCGAHWDVRENLEATHGAVAGKAISAEMWHWGRKLDTPFNQPAQVLSYFVYDDDDGNLDNGTPNYDDICDGVMLHGFECPEILEGVLIAHTPLGSTTDHDNDYNVSANVLSTVGNVTTTTLFYQVDGGGFIEVAMGDDGGDDYSAAIPAQECDGTVEYYIFAEDNLGNTRTHPATAPGTLNSFSIATIIDNLEIGTGWTAGIPGDDATTGVWELIDPNGTAAQPNDDHTPDPGVLCFVTGQCAPGCGLGDNDVDNGSTTLLSPVWDLSAATATAKISYFRWYSNNGSADPNNDDWVVDISNDGGSSWTNVENVNPPNSQQNVWLQVEVDVLALFGVANQVQLRFIASDLNAGSIVEAAVDDVVVVTKAASAGIADAGVSGQAIKFTVHEARPNPFNPSTALSFDVPSDGQVRAEVYDTSGRMIRTLVNGFVEAGSHTMNWDGRSDGGVSVSSGVYHLRVASGASVQTQKLVLLK